ncbi:uncharacterized protein EHS24_003637 [Apiotrichum porosum]|uniref:Major facilitator superfamily (MFS) profile domain-containing protein n=1 Tax=Apiotrichum porosum TaxID=105984 RepID=A0A427XER9_9TREE|nr:uncharacterized protein EHS24_003637 [Apiotrichum porosum]RSH77326.1 hypothetical protein EHS24_003637 [Apiotrichum porosum]
MEPTSGSGRNSPHSSEKYHVDHVEAHNVGHEDVVTAAERGHAATDEHGHVLVDLDPAAEKRLLRKIDLYVVPTVAMIYLWCFIDRANIGNARIAGMEKTLGLVGYQYNTLLTAFYVSNILCKHVGPSKWIPFISFGFGLMSMATAFVRNYGGAIAVRFLLGVFEAGVLPGIAYYLSRWYRKQELIFRLALYLCTAPLAGAFGGLLSAGILKIGSIGSVKGWEMLFLVEGIITMGVSFIAFFTMPDHPSTARWLNAEEKALAIARIKSENVATTEVTDKLDKVKLKRGIFNPNTLVVSWTFLFVNITVQGIAFFTPTIISTIYPHYSTIRKQLYTVPPYLVGVVFNLLIPFLSWKMNRRLVFFIASAVLPIVGYTIFIATTNPHARYGAVFIAISGAFPFGPLCNAQVAINVLSDNARSTAIGWNVMIGNLGGLISTWSYMPADGPNYHIGNGLNLAGNCTILITSALLLLWLQRDNRHREQVEDEKTAELANLSEKEIQELDWKHPAWRWRT